MISIPPQTPSDTIQTPPDTIQTPPDTIQTPPDLDVFMLWRALEVKSMREYHELLWTFANRFAIDTSLNNPSHHLYTPRHLPDTPIHRGFRIRLHWKRRQYLISSLWYEMLPIVFVSIHSQTYQKYLQHCPDSSQTLLRQPHFIKSPWWRLSFPSFEGIQSSRQTFHMCQHNWISCHRTIWHCPKIISSA